MACNENIIKNIANEVTRSCQPLNINVEPEFVVYLIELLLLDPKYGKLFSKTLNRNCLAYFVDECVAMIRRGGTPLNTLKMQFIMRTNYDTMQNLIDKHLYSVDTCLAPLLNEIIDADPHDIAEYKKIYRKISIYILLYSGLGNPSIILNLKEGMSALESVFEVEQLCSLLSLPRPERLQKIEELVQIVSGVRLFNRDCKKGGDMLPELPFDLVDAANASLVSLSNSLISVMQRVNTLTTAVDDRLVVNRETGYVDVTVPNNTDLTIDDFNQIFGLLIFNRQYEMYNRQMLSDVEAMLDTAKNLFNRYKKALDEIHSAVKYKSAVPCGAVFPLFSHLWEVWRAMQNTIFLVGTVDRLAIELRTIQDANKLPKSVLGKMLAGKAVINEERMSSILSECSVYILNDRRTLSEQESSQILPHSEMTAAVLGDAAKEKYIMFLGFCAMCVTVGALVPSNVKIGLIKHKGRRYGFSSLKMAAKFAKHPDRYVNTVIEYARKHPQIINLLNIEADVRSVKDVETLVTKYTAKKLLNDKDIQTEVHPIESYIEHNYSWDLWEWKRRACQWANILKCQTHSTQTNYSHMRSEIHCQTVQPRDKGQQTMKEVGVNTNTGNYFLWGLRGQIGAGQHLMDMVPKHKPENAIPHSVTRCTRHCLPPAPHDVTKSDSFQTSKGSDEEEVFYKPT